MALRSPKRPVSRHRRMAISRQKYSENADFFFNRELHFPYNSQISRRCDPQRCSKPLEIQYLYGWVFSASRCVHLSRGAGLCFRLKNTPILGVYSSIAMKTIKNVLFGAVLFCSASFGFAILPPDASPSSATDSTSIYRKDFVWNSVEKAKSAVKESSDTAFVPDVKPHVSFVPDTRPHVVFVSDTKPHLVFVPDTRPHLASATASNIPVLALEN
jgi:hypothetical protein